TGVGFVTLSRAFAAKVKPAPIDKAPAKPPTASGDVTNRLATVASISLGGALANTVPVVVVEKPGADGIDGLLGLSFLSRFDLTVNGRQIELRVRPNE